MLIERDKLRDNPVGSGTILGMYFQFVEDKKKYSLDSLDERLSNAVICDIDGTIAIHNGRSPYDLTKVKEDIPNEKLFAILKSLQFAGMDIIFVSGREGTKQCEMDTREWLNNQINNLSDYRLYMRPEGDHSNDALVKEQIYREKIEGKFNIFCVFDDRDRTVEKWRQLGLQCYQVNYGGF